MKRGAESAKVFSRDMKQVGVQASQVGLALTKTLTLPIIGAGVAVAKAAIDFESSFAGVRKTVNATESEFAEMSKQFRELAKEIPINVNEINRLGEAAGALGIPKAEIVDFARVMALLGVTTNVTSEQAAEAIAKIQNIFGAAGRDTEKFASTLVALGNDGASTESQILELANRIASAGNAVGLSQAQVLGYASAIANVGIEAEAGGSAISRVFIDISGAVSKGGQAVAEFARISGMSIAQFTEAFKTDAAGATRVFIEGLGKIKASGGDLNNTLNELGFTELRQANLLRSLALSGDNLSKSLSLSGVAWRENSALTEEARKRFETTSAQMTVLWNRVKDVGITLGNALLPTIRDTIGVLDKAIPLIEFFAEGFAALPGPVRLVGVGLLAVAAAAGPLIYVFGQLAISASSVAGAFTAKGIATRGLTASLVGLRAAAVTTGAALVTMATVATAGLGLLAIAISSLAEKWKTLRLQEAESGAKQDSVNLAIARGAEATTTYAKAIEFNDEWLKKRNATLADASREQQRTTGATQALTDKFAALSVSLKAADAEIAQLSASARSDLTKAIQSGAFSMEELEKATGLSSAALKLFKDRLEAAEKPVDELKKALDGIRLAQIPLTAQQQQMIREWRDMGIEAGTMAKALNVSAVAVGNYLSSIDAGIEQFEDSLNKSAEASRTAGAAVATGLVPWIKDLRVQLGDTTIEAKQFAGAMFLVNASVATAGATFASVSLGETLGKSLSEAFASIPGLLTQAFTGGGGIIGAAKAIGVQLAEAVTKPLFDALSRVGKATVTAGASAASALGGAIGGGGGALVGGTAASIGGAVLAGTSLGAAATAGSVAGMVALGAATLGIGVAAVGAYIAIKKLLNDTEKKINPVREAFVQAAGKLDNLNARAKAAGVSLTALLSAKNSEQLKAAIDQITAAVERHDQAVKAAVQTLTSGFNSMASALEGDALAVDALGRSALTTFGLMIAQGATWSEAITAIQPGLSALKRTYEELGIEIQDSALQTLIMQSTILDANPALIQGIDSLAGQFEALATLGMLNAETFADMELIGSRMYTRLQAQVASVGGTTKDALLPMQRWLHEAALQAEELGIPLDANTQMLIDQSKELGVWQERGQSANEKMLEGLSAIVAKLDEFMRRLLGLPASVETTVNTHYTTSGSNEPPSGGGTDDEGYGSAGGLVTALGIQQFKRGGLVRPSYLQVGGMVSRGSDTVPAMLTPGELVLTRPQQEAVGALLHAGGSAGAARYEIHVHTHLNGRIVAEEVIQDFYGAARRLGVA